MPPTTHAPPFPSPILAGITMDKADVMAFDREKRVYKEAYVENFRKVRYFPSLATIGAGRADGASLVLVQEAPGSPSEEASPTASGRLRPNSLGSDPFDLTTPQCHDVMLQLEEIFEATLPLTSFRSAVMCKHTKARREKRLAKASTPPVAASNQNAATARQGATTQQPAFKPFNALEAKTAIQRKISYDGQAFQDKPLSARPVPLRSEVPQWSLSNAASAKDEISSKSYFNVPPEGALKADRKYTQEFIRRNVEASHQAARRHPRDSAVG
ncbi:hypothetical protein BBJ28_00008304 [Nothophytophthora sp. Chile5]|nr:hypothetical protein BBJ28_00008304 [Nothophytophthora sp. Chile5]